MTGLLCCAMSCCAVLCWSTLPHCRHRPGTLQPQQEQELGLGHKEVTLVMTDVQASSKLWEWYDLSIADCVQC